MSNVGPKERVNQNFIGEFFNEDLNNRYLEFLHEIFH